MTAVAITLLATLAFPISLSALAMLALVGLSFLALGGVLDWAPRVRAFKRILMFINLWTIGGFITAIIQTINFFWALADLVIELFLGYSLPEWQAAKRNYKWFVNAHIYAIWADGEANWLPFV